MASEDSWLGPRRDRDDWDLGFGDEQEDDGTTDYLMQSGAADSEVDGRRQKEEDGEQAEVWAHGGKDGDEGAGAHAAGAAAAGGEGEGALVVLDDGLSAGDVLARIERVVACFVEDICTPTPPTLQLISRSRRNVVHQQEDQDQDQAAAVGLGDRTQTCSLLANQGAGAFAFARVFAVLEVAHELLRTGRKATQRDIYYKLLNPPIFNAPSDVNSAIQDAVGLLRVPRSALGICCAPRGAVSGKLLIKDGPMNPWQDCSTAGMAGRTIPGCPEAIEQLGFRCSARYLLVVEKDAIFQALTQDRLFDVLPCVMVTAKGMPDIATRAFCCRLLSLFPALTVLGLVDWNPSGVAILKTYKYGSRSIEGSRFTLPTLSWLGLRACMLPPGPERSPFLTPLTRRDRSLASGLLTSLSSLGEHAWCEELREMTAEGVDGNGAAAGGKADIEVLYSLSRGGGTGGGGTGGGGGMAGLCGTLAQAVVRREYV